MMHHRVCDCTECTARKLATRERIEQAFAPSVSVSPAVEALLRGWIGGEMPRDEGCAHDGPVVFVGQIVHAERGVTSTEHCPCGAVVLRHYAANEAGGIVMVEQRVVQEGGRPTKDLANRDAPGAVLRMMAAISPGRDLLDDHDDRLTKIERRVALLERALLPVLDLMSWADHDVPTGGECATCRAARDSLAALREALAASVAKG